MRAETSLSLSLSLSLGLRLAPQQLLPWETGCQQGCSWPHHLCGICLTEVIGGSAPTATLAINVQVNSFFCEVLFTHIALPGAACGCSSERLEPRTTVFGDRSGENVALGEQGRQAHREGLA